ncbi:ATP-binding cassette domain-containing protein [Sulfurimonas sp.]|jgi:ABC-type glutathione transport system ATPase component|uniref:ATP-binding cassette domain-containing protein n=1 Tax=Sulfurimonas sp. TaxID=2022749 RepID=UPI0025F85CE5|nr:ATP-binding cassette domain-containing protein [Sulfurimonas sp.]MBT5933817.1 ABC transporter ATP-binding protein [Sulfurimonas sp.]
MKIEKLVITHKNNNLVDINLNIDTSLALVGESGSGKSLTLKALLSILPQDMSCELKINSDFDLIAGESVAFIPQNPFTALSPLTKIKKQFFVKELLIKELFDKVDLDYELLERFPPELSGGQLQRVLIAMALSISPKLLLLDEPTTALDPQTRELILQLLGDLQKKEHFKILFVTHDITSVKVLCQDIAVLKNGKIIESGKMSDIISSPKQEYTKVLIESNFVNREFRK